MSTHFATTTHALPAALGEEGAGCAVFIDGNAFLQMLGKPKDAVTFKDCSQAPNRWGNSNPANCARGLSTVPSLLDFCGKLLL